MIRQTNLNSMKKRAEYLYYALDDLIVDTNPNIDIQSYQAVDGDLYTVIQTESMECRLNSTYSPSNEANKWAEQYNSNCYGRTNRIFLVYGFSNGYFIRELIKNLDEDESIIIYEPCKEMFLHVLDNYNIADILENEDIFIVVEGINHNVLNELLRKYEINIMHGQSVLVALPDYEQLFNDKLLWFMDLYNDIYISAIMNRNTAATYGEKWAEAEIDNLEIILKSNLIEECRGILPDDVPVILVASGPSLNKNATVLNQAKGKALILAVDSSVKYLNHYGVNPDFIVTVDVIKLLSHFQNPVAMHTPMLASVMANPNVLKLNTERKIFFDDNSLIKEIKDIKEPAANIVGAGSVATSAFELAVYLGAKRIILVGQDLAFEGNASHAMGQRLQEEYSTEFFELIEGNDGTMLKTRFDWYKYLCWFNERIPKFDGVVVNATEGGAKIKGTLVMPLEAAINEYCTSDYSADVLFKQIDENGKGSGDILILKKGLLEVQKQLKDTKICLDEAIQLTNKLLRENGKSLEESYTMKNCTKRLVEINSIINKKPINQLLEQYTYSTTMKEYQTLFVHCKDKQKNRDNVYRKTLKVYEAMKTGTEKMEMKVTEQLKVYG